MLKQILNFVLLVLSCILMHSGISYATPSNDQNLMKLDMDVFDQPNMPWFKPEKCDEKLNGNIYVTFSGDKSAAVYLIPVSAYERSFPTINILENGKDGHYIANIPKLSGCKSSPFQVTRLMLKRIPDIAGVGFILSLKENRHDTNLLKLRDAGSCPSVEEGLLKCSGTQTIAGRPTKIEYFMSANLLQNSGGPLRARCLYSGDHRVCTVEDSISENTSYEVIMNEPPELKSILKARESAILYLKKIEVKSK